MATGEQTLTLEVTTPLGMALSVTSDSIQVPSVAGEFGVLRGHLPLLAAVKPGILKYRLEGVVLRAAVGAGFVEADSEKVRLRAEFFVASDDVNAEDARSDREAAEARLKSHGGAVEETEHKEAQRDLDWALARLELAGGDAS